MDSSTHNILVSKSHIDPTSGCRLWDGQLDSNGYGLLRTSSGAVVRAHRTAFACWVGPLSDSEVVRHRCDNPSCIRPHHLVSGTQKDNVYDMLERHGSPVRRSRYSSRCINDHVLFASNVGRRPNGSKFCIRCDRANLRALAAEVGEVLR